MGRDQRKAVRRRVDCRASVAANERAERQDCLVRDLSDSGARIVIDPAIELPPQFLLLLSRNVSRRCRLIWRKEREAGVQFRKIDAKLAE